VNIKKTITRLGLVAYLGVLVTASLWPTPVDGGGVVWFVTSEILKFCHSISWLSWIQYNQLETLANVALYIPLGAFLVLLLPRVPVILLCLTPLVVSGIAEGLQRWFLPERYSTLDDVLHNALGGFIGVVISASIRQLLRLRAKARSTSQGQ
jgi:glycopeptide antibiotics resistance protein